MEGNFSKITLGEQIATYLKDKIKKNEFKDGMLPKEEDLAVQLNVSRGTIRSAMAILEAEDLILRVKKRGTMIRGFSLQFPDLKRVKRLNIFYFGQSIDFFLNQTQGFYSYIFNAILAEAAKRQYVLNVGLIEIGLQEKNTLKKCLELESEGNILFAISNEDIARKIYESGKPSILVDHQFEKLPIETANVDSYQGSYDGVNYLYQRGHRKFLFVNHYRDTTNPDRVRGVQDAIRDLKIPAKSYFEIKISPHFEVGYETCLKMIDKFPPVTGIICFSSDNAFGFIKALEEKGYNVPKDFSVIGSGNISDQGSPKLTTVEFDLQLLGRMAVVRLLDMIKGNNKENMNEKVKGHIVERGSVRDITK